MGRVATLIFGMGLSLAAGSALACPDPHRRHDRDAAAFDRDDRAYGYDERDVDQGSYDQDDEDDFGPAGQPPVGASAWYMDGRHPAPPCDCEDGGPRPLQLSNSFFYDAGGVGPIPDGGGYGGGWYGGGGYVVGGGSSRASAFSSASSSASASVRISGGRRYGGGYGGHGGKGHGGKGH